ncbi:MAG: hydroxymethylglutaryl-CoA lyase [Burkholderiales bacterium]|nr:hydroxymethylglutaryl-CoA lyase [Burkholderiales bacterium]
MTRVLVNEVAPRDGLQMEQRFVPTHEKIAFVDALSDCGFAKIEVTSFTSARAIPALADAEVVMREIRRVPGVVYTALVPNLRGMERAIESRVDELNLVMSCSESHNVANLRMGRAQSLAQLLQVVREAGHGGVLCNVSLSCAFGCPFEGEVPVDEVARIALALMAGGAAGITLCDTTGMADPLGVRRLLDRLHGTLAIDSTTVHLHDTRGMALANALAALESGASRFDASCAGLGGCPYAPGASGNVNTETLVHMFQCMGHATGIDLARLLRVAARVPALVARALPNALVAAGPRDALHPLPAS